MYITEVEWKMLEPYIEPCPGTADLLSDKDRELAKLILKSKQHLGPLGMIEVGIVLGRMLSDFQKSPT